MPKLGVVIASVREGRVGLPVAQWFVERARQHAQFEIEVIDLKNVDLPIFAERYHPRMQM
jgi:NAD(P)H-dependent FMN reductase